VLLILGCQRSGTTLISNLFDQDRRAVTFSEESELLSGRERPPLRLNELHEVNGHLAGL